MKARVIYRGEEYKLIKTMSREYFNATRKSTPCRMTKITKDGVIGSVRYIDLRLMSLEAINQLEKWNRKVSLSATVSA